MSATLTSGAILQGGRYHVERVLGQGGFGITYLATHTGFGQKVALKEFFMKELCVRNEETSYVTLGSEASSATVGRFREKFLKEARNLFRLNHKHIVRVLDIFEENGTAYFAMEYAEGGSLSEKVKMQGALPEAVATRYIQQVAEALAYLHEQKMNHLDVKPANIMLSAKDNAVLIDFGLAKQYDATGSQTSTTPAGISEGYAPMEQYKLGGVAEFTPETDIYALGATFFKLLTGVTPPSAQDVFEDGVPVETLRQHNVSEAAISVIEQAMKPSKKKRMSSAQVFVEGLGTAPAAPESDEDTRIVESAKTEIAAVPEAVSAPQTVVAPHVAESTREEKVPTPTCEVEDFDEEDEGSGLLATLKNRKWWIAGIAAVVLVLSLLLMCNNNEQREPNAAEISDTDAVAADTADNEDPYYFDPNHVYNFAEESPSFPGGEEALLHYISTHVQYPEIALENEIQGVVTLRFVVNEDGSIGDVQVTKNLEQHCDNEAIRVVKSLPRFVPGKQQGKPVKTWFTLPIRYQLE